MSEPLRIALPLGIGDNHWVCTKLSALSRLHGGRPIEAHVNKSVDHASIGYLELVPMVAKAVESPRAIYHIYEDLDAHYKDPKWSTLAGSANWREYDYVLQANGHLESGKSLASWLPELETEYQYDLNIQPADIERARELAAPGSVLLYPSGVSANKGFHRNTWTVQHWAVVIRMLNQHGIKPVLMGAASKNDMRYRAQLMRVLGRLKFTDTIGQTNIPQALSMIEDASAWCGLNSGLGIISGMRCRPTLMLWADARYPIKGSSTYTMHPEMQRSWLNEEQLKTYRTLSYGSPELTPARVVREILQLVQMAGTVAA